MKVWMGALSVEHSKPGPSTYGEILDGPVEDSAMRGSELNGFAGKHVKWFWRCIKKRALTI